MRKGKLREEIIRCANDPAYFINTYVKIRHPTRGLIPFKTFLYQEQTLEAFRKKRFNVILKPRQMGFTELTSAFIVWLILFHPNQSVLCMATKAETATEVVRRVKTALSNIPRWLLIANIDVNNRRSIELSNGSFVKSISKSRDAGRSEALSLLVIDEAAHIDGFDQIWTGIKPTVSAGGRIIMLSTPNGVGNVFHRTYTEAVSKANDFNPIRVEWWEHPEHISDLEIDKKTGKYTSSWFRKETKGMTPREIAQEHECAFHGSGDTYFGIELIDRVKISELDFGLAEGLQIYSEPIPNRSYIMSIDSSTGNGIDRTGMPVFDIETMDQVAELNSVLKPDGIAMNAIEIGRKYNNALMVVESNAVGLATIEHLKMARYPNFFYSRKGAQAGDQLGAAGPAEEGGMSDKFVHGIMTLGTNRPFMLSKLEELIRNGSMTIRSSRFRNEMETFIWNNGRPEAKSGKRDDLILATAMLVWVRDNMFGGTYTNDDVVSAMLKSITLDQTTNIQVQGASKNPDLVPARTLGAFGFGSSPYSMRLPNGRNIDLAMEMGMHYFIPSKG